MNPSLDQLRRFRAVLERQLGLSFGEDRTGDLAAILQDRTRLAVAPDCTRYIDKVASGDRDEIGKLAERLTVGETYFFRNRDQFDALMHHALPDRLRVRGGARPVRILSAGCASGEEPYTVAILARQAGLSDAVAIEAFDLNPAAIARARAMRYSTWSLRETPAALRDQMFRPDKTHFGAHWRLDDKLRDSVAFSERNLLDEDPALWPAGAWDIVFCRNVLMYFPADVMRAVLVRIARSLAPGGYLFLGHAESLRGASPAFHLRQSHGTFYYQRPLLAGATDTVAETSVPSLLETAPLWADTAWVDAIRVASARITQLVDYGVDFPPQPIQPRSAPEIGIRKVQVVRDLLSQERYQEALTRVIGMRAEAGAQSDVDHAQLCLLHAVLLTHAGDLPAAEALCRDLLALDNGDPGVHYLLALCREHAGDLAGAIENDRWSTRSDPMFAMPHLHLGMLARRAGDPAEARKELEIALALLAREDPRRILLFGGGFGRQALEGLCRAELRACGGGQ